MAAVDVKKPIVSPPVPPSVGPPPVAAKPSSTSAQPRTLELRGHVGFDSLPHQLVQKAMETGFSFNILCVGETGIGKTTLMESLFNMSLDFEPCNHELNTVELRSKVYDIEEGGVHLKLTIVETAGFGDQLDKDKSAAVIVDYIDNQFEKYLQEELKIKRCLQLYHDTRIHACLYFISPTGHGLKALDVTTMRELAQKVNVIPVIAKADTTCKGELQRFKHKILSELKAQHIDLYKFPEDDESVRQNNSQLNTNVPFAVVGSTDFVTGKNAKKVRARQYPWGIVEVENEEHCDFVKLREALLRVNVEDLCDKTDRVLYEKYRRERLTKMGIHDGDTGPKMAQALQNKQKNHRDELAKREEEMKQMFVERVNAKEKELKTQEEELIRPQQEDITRLNHELNELNQEIQRVDQERLFLDQKVAQITAAGAKKKK